MQWTNPTGWGMAGRGQGTARWCRGSTWHGTQHACTAHNNRQSRWHVSHRHAVRESSSGMHACTHTAFAHTHTTPHPSVGAPRRGWDIPTVGVTFDATVHAGGSRCHAGLSFGRTRDGVENDWFHRREYLPRMMPESLTGRWWRGVGDALRRRVGPDVNNA